MLFRSSGTRRDVLGVVLGGDASLTPDKKKEALQQIDDQYASLQDSTPLPGNAEAVKPYLDKLKPIAEAN